MSRSRRVFSAVMSLALCASLVPVAPLSASAVEPPVLTWQLVSEDATAAAQYVSVADDGSRIAYCANDAFVVDVAGGVVQAGVKASLDSTGGPINGVAEQTALSGDGSVVAFASTATDVVALDTNGEVDIFARDLSAGANSIVSVAGTSIQGDFASVFPNLDDSGAHVAFQSYADNLSGSDNDAVINLFVRSRVASTTQLVNGYRNGSSYGLDLADSGTVGVFTSSASDFGVADSNGQIDVVRWNGGSSYTVVSTVPGGTSTGNGGCTAAAISDDGSVIAFGSSASNISAGDINAKSDIFVWTSATGVTRIDNGPAGVQLNGDSSLLDLSGDGRFVLFSTTAANAPSGPGLYVRDLAEGPAPVFLGALASSDAELGASGDFVALSTTTDLGGDGDALADVYLASHDFESPSAEASVAALYAAAGGPVITAADNEPGVVACWRYGTDATQTASSPAVATVPDAAGSHTLTYWALDAAGNMGRLRTAIVVVGDTRAPESSAGTVEASYDGTATISLTAADPALGTGSSGVAGIEWWSDPDGYAGGTTTGSSVLVPVARAGERTLYWRAWDHAGNYEETRSVSFTVNDITAPFIDIWELGSYNDRAQVTVYVDDGFNGVGPTQLQYRVDSGASQDATVQVDPGNTYGFASVDVTGLGTHTLDARACDGAGNWSEWAAAASFEVVDQTEPTIVMAEKGAGPDESTLVHLSGTDNGDSPSGVASLEWKVGGGALQTAVGDEATITVPGYPGQTLEYWAVDGAGNRSPGNSNWIIVADGRAPSVTITVDTDATPIRATFTATDPEPGGGVERVRWSKNGLEPGQTFGATAFEEFSEPGTATVEVWAYDVAGNESAHETTQIVVPDEGGGTGGDALELRSITVDGDADWANSATLTVDIDASAATQMRFARSVAGLEDASWTPYAPSAELALPGDPGDGEWPVWVEVQDAGGVTASAYDTIRVDRVAPITNSNATDDYDRNIGAEVDFSADDPSSGPFSASGVAQTYYRVNGGTPRTGSSHVLDTAGDVGFEWWSVDVAGNVEASRFATVTVLAVPTELTLGLPATTVTYPKTALLTATLKNAETGGAVADRPVLIERSSSNAAPWSTVATLTTGATGEVTTSLAPSATGYFRLRFAGDGVHASATTSGRKVTVKPYLTTPVPSKSTVTKGKTFKVYAYVRPKHSSGIRFRFKHVSSGRWKTVTVKYASTSDPTKTKVYAYTSLPYKGTWKAYAYHSDSSHYSPAYSGYKKMTVK